MNSSYQQSGINVSDFYRVPQGNAEKILGSDDASDCIDGIIVSVVAIKIMLQIAYENMNNHSV